MASKSSRSRAEWHLNDKNNCRKYLKRVRDNESLELGAVIDDLVETATDARKGCEAAANILRLNKAMDAVYDELIAVITSGSWKDLKRIGEAIRASGFDPKSPSGRDLACLLDVSDQVTKALRSDTSALNAGLSKESDRQAFREMSLRYSVTAAVSVRSKELKRRTLEPMEMAAIAVLADVDDPADPKETRVATWKKQLDRLDSREGKAKDRIAALYVEEDRIAALYVEEDNDAPPR